MRTSGQFQIPEELQARALNLHYTNHSARQIWQSLYPAADGPRLDTFTRAMQALIVKTESDYVALAKQEGIPVGDVFNAPDEKLAALALAPAVIEQPLSAADNEALADLDRVRAALCIQIGRCMTDPLPDLEDTTEVDERGEKKKAAKGWDPIVARSSAITALATALNANVSTRLRATALRVQRTVTYHNLRIANKDEAMLDERAARKDGAIDMVQAIQPGFVLDMDTKH